MVDSRKLLLFIIGILLGAAIGIGTYVILTNQPQTGTTQYQAQIQVLLNNIEEKKQ